jgi:hypothetical protein
MNGIKKEINLLDRKIENVEGSLNAKIANVELNLARCYTKMSRLPFVRVLEHFK